MRSYHTCFFSVDNPLFHIRLLPYIMVKIQTSPVYSKTSLVGRLVQPCPEPGLVTVPLDLL